MTPSSSAAPCGGAPVNDVRSTPVAHIPQVMFTLFKDIDLSGKTVIPFTTHEGSGLANCVSDVKKAFPKANVTKGFSIYGHEVRTGKAKVEKWLLELRSKNYEL